jgi:hypothetical protein
MTGPHPQHPHETHKKSRRVPESPHHSIPHTPSGPFFLQLDLLIIAPIRRMSLANNLKTINLMTVSLIRRTVKVIELVIDVADCEGSCPGANLFAADGAVDLWGGAVVTIEVHRCGRSEEAAQKSEDENCDTCGNHCNLSFS